MQTLAKAPYRFFFGSFFFSKKKERRLAVIAVALLFTSSLHAQEVKKPSFHHVHLNVVDPEVTIAYYRKFHGAVPIRYAGISDALFVERSFILMNKVASPAPSAIKTGLWHIGWGGRDVPSEYAWFVANGADINTELYALNNIHVMYLNGPDKEMIEVNTMGHNRFGHVHLLAEDVNATTGWYAKHLGLAPRRAHVPKPEDMTKVRAWSSGFRCDNVSFVVYGRPDYTPKPPWWKDGPLTEQVSTKGRVIDHIAFSYRELEPEFARLKKEGVTILEGITFKKDFNHRSFFVEGPDKVMIEVVEAKPIPEGIWE
jgi:catechol 2,3-dioxygenase-like lactoylglutathione lyase family enzyme